MSLKEGFPEKTQSGGSPTSATAVAAPLVRPPSSAATAESTAATRRRRRPAGRGGVRGEALTAAVVVWAVMVRSFRLVAGRSDRRGEPSETPLQDRFNPIASTHRA